MEPEIFADDYYVVETDDGDYHIPVTVSGRVKSIKQLCDYCGSNPRRMEMRTGYVCRLSMPGYLDSTDWTGFDTEVECRDHLADMYDCEFDEDD